MSPIQQQLEREARYDVRVAVIGLVIFFGCMALLPRSAFWFYLVPLAAFWFRYLFVRDRRDEALLSTEFTASGGSSAAGCYRTESGICISDGSHQVLVAREKLQPLLQLTDIGRRQ